VTVADTLINSVKVLAALAWLNQIDLAGYWLVQHTAPIRDKPDGKPGQEGARYKYQTNWFLTRLSRKSRTNRIHLPILLLSLG